MRALVLGGGGMFGAFQAGAWTVLEQELDFDCIVGASAGALNAWAVAGGVSGEQLEDLWRHVGDHLRLRLRLPRYWMDGVMRSEELEQLVGKLVAELVPRKRLGVAVSQGWSLQPKLFTDASIGEAHLLASCAVPFILPAKRLEGRLSLDGGIRDACPVWGAWQMGACETVAVNVWTHLPWWWPMPAPVRDTRDSLAWIVPPQRLGPVRSSMMWERGRIEQWIAMGRQAARAALPDIVRRFARK